MWIKEEAEAEALANKYRPMVLVRGMLHHEHSFALLVVVVVGNVYVRITVRTRPFFI